MNQNARQTATLLELMSGIVSALPSGLIAISEEGYVTLANTKALCLLGIRDKTLKECIDKDFHSVLSSLPDLLDKIDRLIIKGKYSEIELPNQLVGDQTLAIQCFSMLKGTLILINPISQDSALWYHENNDMLTQLNNRQFFERQFTEFLKGVRSRRQSAALVFFDIDNFKFVNDSFGYTSGDDVLRKVATMLKSRTSSGQPVARIGADQFAVLLDGYSVHEAQSFAESVIRHIDSSHMTALGAAVRVTVSSGVVPFYTDSAPELTKLLSVANSACTAAKESGRNRTHVFDMEDNSFDFYIQGVSWVTEINRALEEQKFVLFGQKISPILYPDEYDYYEVLIRLKGDDGEVLSPYAFLPTAERYHMMPEIDRYVLRSLFSSMGSKCHHNYSVNLSGQTISDFSLIDYINKMLDCYVFDPNMITFEITETAAMNDFKSTIEVMNSLRQLGFKFSLDDFGTGLSSFTYLKELPLDVVKIDGSFVKDIANDKISYQMVKSIHDIANAMGLKTVAEFVESKAVFETLAEIGIQYAQGYYIHKPEPIISI